MNMTEQNRAISSARTMLNAGYGTPEWHTLHIFKITTLIAVLCVTSFAGGMVAVSNFAKNDQLQTIKIVEIIQEQSNRAPKFTE